MSRKQTPTASLVRLLLAMLFLSPLTACNSGGGDDDKNPVSGDPLDPSASAVTLMIFLNADNNLDFFAEQDMQEMIRGMQNVPSATASSLAVIVQYDGPSSGDTRIYRITPSGRTTLETLAERNMGDPETLGDFIRYCRENYPADRYDLVLWDHGDGARSALRAPDAKAISVDDSSNDALLMNEVQEALSGQFGPANPMGLIGFDACLMGTIEVAYELREYARTMAASMHLEQANGWDYEGILENGERILAGSASFAELVVDTYRDWIQDNYSGQGQTMAAIDLSRLDELRIAVDGLADVMRTNLSSSGADHWYAAERARALSERYYIDNSSLFLESSTYIDLGDLCNVLIADSGHLFTDEASTAAAQVRTALGQAVIKAFGDSGNDMAIPATAYFGAGPAVRRGLSIFFQQPPYSGNYDYDFANWKQYYEAYNGWYTGSVYNEGSWGSGGQLDFCRDSAWKTLVDYVFASNHPGYAP